MGYEAFVKELMERLRTRYPGAWMERQQTTRNNSVRRESLLFRKEGGSLSLLICLQPYYAQVQSGRPMEDLILEIERRICSQVADSSTISAWLEDGQKARSHVVARLVNTRHNQELLTHVPSIPFHNLSIIFYYTMDLLPDGRGAVLVQNSFLTDWQMNVRELAEAAAKNTWRLYPPRFCLLSDLMHEHMKEIGQVWDPEEGPDPFREEGTPSLYVLTNSQNSFGAYWMTDENVLRNIAEQTGMDFYVLPSSVHECIIIGVRDGEETDEAELIRMVREVNAVEVAPEEVLADCVYYYSRKEGSLELCC